MAIIYTNQSSGRKRRSTSKRLELARQEHKEFLVAMGYSGGKRKAVTPEPKTEIKRPEPILSNSIPGNCYKHSIDDWRWKRGQTESAATIAEIERKKSRIAPLWNKGATMFITDGEDPKTLGKKV